LTLDTNKPMVWIIDRQQWPRALLRAELVERGYEAVGFVEVDEALRAFRERLYVIPRLIIIELKDLPEGEERVRALTGLGIPTVFLAGAAEEQRAVLQGTGWTVLLKRPFTIGRVMEEVERQVGRLKTEGGGAANSECQNHNAK
jgi:DNA-binding response OmpR family regulator